MEEKWVSALKETLPQFPCECGQVLELIFAEIKDGKASGKVYCEQCDEFGHATFVI